jgi:hypothetical protein
MSNIFKAMRAKKKRAVDPDAPPRPTLLGHEKEMKTWRQQFSELTERSIQQSVEINMLRRKVNRLEGQIDAMTSVINRRPR